MADGFVYWYEASWSEQRALRMVTTLESAGLMLTNPNNNQVTEISSDLETMGQPITTDRNNLLRKCALRDSDQYSFNYWLDGDINVYCRIRRVAPHSVVNEFGLDGLTIKEQDVTIRAILGRISDDANFVLGFIVDRTGGSAELDWDAIVVNNSAQVSILPDALGLQSNVFERHQELRTMRTRKFGPLLVSDRSGILNSV